MDARSSQLMRAALLHGPGDLRVQTIDAPIPADGELLIRLEACGICPTDVRKYRLGADSYPLNPGHEWVGRVSAVGEGTDGWRIGDRVYGDTYAGYAELATIGVRPEPWSAGPVRLPDELPIDRAVFVEPLADCLHAVHDRAAVEAGQRVAVVGAGQMGLQLCATAALAGAHVTAVEELEVRRRLAVQFGAEETVDRSPAGSFDAVIITVGDSRVVEPTLRACVPGGRVVLFAGFADEARTEIDLNLLHYKELTLTGSEWVGTPPDPHRDRYQDAIELLVAGRVPVERLVTSHCRLDGLHAAFDGLAALRDLKTVLVFE